MATQTTAVRDDFATYVATRRPALLRAASAITGDPGSAEDLLQSALLSVMTHWDSLRDRGAADAYVRRAMVNQQHSWFRKRSTRVERPVAELPERTGAAETVPDPAEAVELRAALWDLVMTLPPRQRAIVVLRHYEQCTEQETARALGVSVGTVKSATARGLATLRIRLAEADLPVSGRPTRAA